MASVSRHSSSTFDCGCRSNGQGQARNGFTLAKAFLNQVPIGYKPCDLKSYFGKKQRDPERLCSACGKNDRGLGNGRLPECGAHCEDSMCKACYVVDVMIMLQKGRITNDVAVRAIEEAVLIKTTTHAWCATERERIFNGGPTGNRRRTGIRAFYHYDQTRL